MQLSEGNFKEKEKLAAGPRWTPDTKPDWLVGRKLTSTSTSLYLNISIFWDIIHHSQLKANRQLNSTLTLVLEGTVPTEQPPLVG
jgi:hypothetical protein